MSIIIVITKARKSGGRPANRRHVEIKLAPRREVFGEANSRSANEEVPRAANHEISVSSGVPNLRNMNLVQNLSPY